MATIRRSPCRQCPIDTTVRGLRAARCHAERPFRVCNRFRRGRFRRAIGRGEAAGKGGRSSAAGCPACGWDSPCAARRSSCSSASRTSRPFTVMVQYPTSRSISHCPKISRSGARLASDPRHAGGPLRPATVIDSEVLLDDLDTRAPAWLAGKYLQYG